MLIWVLGIFEGYNICGEIELITPRMQNYTTYYVTSDAGYFVPHIYCYVLLCLYSWTSLYMDGELVSIFFKSETSRDIKKMF